MSKGIEFTPIQIKAYENGATMFLFPIQISNFCKEMGNTLDDIEKVVISDNGLTYSIYFKTDDRQTSEMPFKKGDKDIFVQEEFTTDSDEEYGINDELVYYSDTEDYWFGTHEDNPQKYRNQWQPASKMTKDQSRYSFNECIDAKAIRVQEINIKDIPKIQTEMWMFDDWYNQQLKEQNINRTYEDNDYVFLVEFA